jgi:hypothetical protein
MMFGCVSEHFANLRYVKDAKLVFDLNALFRGTKVAKHPFKMMFGSVSEHFTNIRYVKDAKLVFESQCTISGYQSCEAFILVHWSQNDVCEYFR